MNMTKRCFEDLAAIVPVMNPLVGFRYRVPVAYNMEDLFCWPVHPTPHTDVELQFPHPHIHFDFRFFNQTHYKKFYAGRSHSRVMLLRDDFTRIGTRDWLCYRADSGVPTDEQCAFTHEFNFANLDTPNINLKALNCGRCPHKGHRFDSGSVRSGILHCPLHGLKFDTETGCLLPCGKKK